MDRYAFDITHITMGKLDDEEVQLDMDVTGSGLGRSGDADVYIIIDGHKEFNGLWQWAAYWPKGGKNDNPVFFLHREDRNLHLRVDHVKTN